MLAMGQHLDDLAERFVAGGWGWEGKGTSGNNDIEDRLEIPDLIDNPTVMTSRLVTVGTF